MFITALKLFLRESRLFSTVLDLFLRENKLFFTAAGLCSHQELSAFSWLVGSSQDLVCRPLACCFAVRNEFVEKF